MASNPGCVHGSRNSVASPTSSRVSAVRRWRSLLNKFERRAEPAVLDALVRATDLTSDGLSDRAKVDSAVAAIEAYLRANYPDTRPEATIEVVDGGTRFVWVVRLTGPRRVEVHAPGKKVRLAKAR